MLASLSEEALLRNGHGYKGKVQKIKVPAISIATLVAKHNIERVDLLQIDTEGYDFEILKMFFSQTSLRPRIIQFENGNRDGKEYEDFCCSLEQQGYRMLSTGIDTVAYMQTDESPFAEAHKNLGYKA